MDFIWISVQTKYDVQCILDNIKEMGWFSMIIVLWGFSKFLSFKDIHRYSWAIGYDVTVCCRIMQEEGKVSEVMDYDWLRVDYRRSWV